MRLRFRWIFCIAGMLLGAIACSSTDAAGSFENTVLPLMKAYCLDCHSSEVQEGDLDLERFSSIDEVRDDPKVWQDVLQQIADGEMPPKEKPRFTSQEYEQFTRSIQSTLDEIALAQAGDPGPVVLRRLSNHEYTYTIRDLTGVLSLDPAAAFPVDGAAGEGFTNVGSALVMSPALLTKYLDAAKDVASHAVVLSDRIAFSPSTSRSDWTQEKLDEIRRLYARYATPGTEIARNLQGVEFSTTDGGIIPIERYLNAIHQGEVADSEGDAPSDLSPIYLEKLTAALNDDSPSVLLDPIRALWRDSKSEDIPAIAALIGQWQDSLWHFAKVGHIGKRDGPKAWQLPLMPIASSQLVRLKMPEAGEGLTTIYLTASDAGDGNTADVIVWEDARLTFDSEPPVALRHVEALLAHIRDLQERELTRTAEYLESVETAFHTNEPLDQIALQRGLIPKLAMSWSEWVRLNSAAKDPSGHLKGKQENVGGYSPILGWGDGLPNLLVNQSDSEIAFSTLRVPGRGVTVHPAPKSDSVVYWKSPVDSTMTIKGLVADMDGVCGNGSDWSVDLINASGSQRLAGDQFANGGRAEFGPIENVSVKSGDLIKLTVQARSHDHTCDTTQVDLRITDSVVSGRSWGLANEIVDRLHESNPLSDSYGNPGVWHFCRSQEETPASQIPTHSMLEKWRYNVIEGRPADALAVQEQILAPTSEADRVFQATCYRLRGPLKWNSVGMVTFDQSGESTEIEQVAPSVVEFRLPADFVAGAELIANVALHAVKGAEGSVQAFASLEKPPHPLSVSPGRLIPVSESRRSSWTDVDAPVVSDRPILVREGSETEKRIVHDITEFQSLFPAALCYEKIVPVDEVVTLTLRYREDDQLQRLMLNARQRSELDQLWDDMSFVSRQPLQQLDAYNQLWQYATQDADPSAFEPMREPIQRAASAFERRLIEVEPQHLVAVLNFAAEAWRRPLSDAEQSDLQSLYQQLREQGLAHESSIRQLLARVLVAPAFLYRGETAAPGRGPTPVNDWELATRLSYFLWSSAPDAELRTIADAEGLGDVKVLTDQMHRMLSNEKVRRLATEFGCQWLHVRDLETLDEKSERHFPTFVDLRADMQEEITRFFMDFFQEDRSIVSLLNADYTFVNGPLAAHYGVSLDTESWQRIDGMRAMGRGGILGFAGTLAKQSGASRTSPILRGNWINEVLLGERLPRPPKDVPVLPDEPPQGLTERELIERHSRDAQCARCHQRIDPFGFSLEAFDAIGRSRSGLDTVASLADGTTFEGIEGLRSYLLDRRQEDFVRQFCRKLLGYALGRSIQLSDEPLLDGMLVELRQNDFRVRRAVEMIVLSPQFLNVRGRDFLVSNTTRNKP